MHELCMHQHHMKFYSKKHYMIDLFDHGNAWEVLLVNIIKVYASY
jgi:hypothetical protein